MLEQIKQKIKIENLITAINESMNRFVQLRYEEKNEFQRQRGMGIARSMSLHTSLQNSANSQLELIERWNRELENIDYE